MIATMDRKKVDISAHTRGGGGNGCPGCGCLAFKTYGTIQQSTGSVRRYVECLNQNCGRQWVTIQEPPRFVREVDSKRE